MLFYQSVIRDHRTVIPAKAGIQGNHPPLALDRRFRRGDKA
jgi:hypothetical protein